MCPILCVNGAVTWCPSRRGPGWNGLFQSGIEPSWRLCVCAASTGSVTKQLLDGATSVIGSTRGEMRHAFDQVQGFGQRLALEHTKPFAGVPMPGKVEAIPTDVFQTGERCIEFRFG
jgi:hypothetical protein